MSRVALELCAQRRSSTARELPASSTCSVTAITAADSYEQELREQYKPPCGDR